MENCPFCNTEMVKEQVIRARNEHCMFLQMPQEVLIGSGVIVPFEHRETVFDVTEQEWASTYALLREVKGLLDESHRPDGYTIGWNSGDAGGQHIRHAHLHIIPRFKDEPYAGKGIRHWLKSSENKRTGSM